MHDETVVELEGVSGQWFTWAGPNAGDHNQYLGTGVKGLYDPPVKVVYEEPGNYPGARYLNHRILRRDITLAILIPVADGDDPLGAESELRKALSYEEDAYLHVTTPISGHRKLAVRLGDAPDVDMETDPHMGRLVVVKLLLIAGDPFWYEDDVVYSAVTGTDTTFQPTIFGDLPYRIRTTLQAFVGTITTGIQTAFDNLMNLLGVSGTGHSKNAVVAKLQTITGTVTAEIQGALGALGAALGLGDLFDAQPQETLTISVPVCNPTDQYIWAKWTLPASKGVVPDFPWPFPPGIPIPWDRAPFTQFVIPDYSFEDPDYANRRIKTPGLIIGEDCVVDTDPRQEQFTSASGSQLWARTNGVRFRNPIPPYTGAKDFVVRVSGCTAGQMITMRLPRPWSRPWGLE